MKVGGPNTVELLGHYGSDWTHAQSAWTSTKRDLTEKKRQRMPKLIAMLAGEGHHTPFEKSSLHFLVTTDIATHIHLLKHRVGVSINAESARYKELRDDKFYVPYDWPAEEMEHYISYMENALEEYHVALERLQEKGMSRKRAKETARFYLPYGNQIKADVQFNFRSFMHFCGLRFSEHAQRECCELSREMLRQVWSLGEFTESLVAFGYTLDKIETAYRE